jgi:hypothetical protein
MIFQPQANLSSGELVTFSTCRVFEQRTGCFLNPSQIRHPERSAARIYRITDGLCAKSKDPGDACWQMLFQAFQPRTTCQIKKVTSSERTRISCHAALERTTCAPFSKERRMKLANATNFNRKSGEAEGICSSLNRHQRQIHNSLPAARSRMRVRSAARKS